MTSGGRGADLRKTLMGMVAGVVVLDAVAIAIYYLAHLATAGPRVQLAYTGVWMFATVAVVGTGLQRIRRVRYRG